VVTLFDNWIMETIFEGHSVEMSIWDTDGQEDFDDLRLRSYNGANVILICYSPDFLESLENIEVKWVPEICHFCPGVPYLLVCCKSDLREDVKTVASLQRRGERTISAEEGAEMAKKISASAHMECSAKFNLGINEVFEAAAQLALGSASTNRRRRKRKCLIL
jgi:Ras homolog gene family, member A